MLQLRYLISRHSLAHVRRVIIASLKKKPIMSAVGAEGLDDFFAKKDKKKAAKKSKSKFTPDDFHPINEKPKTKLKKVLPKPAEAGDNAETTKEEEETVPKDPEAAKEEDVVPPVEHSLANLGLEDGDDEWNDFDAERKVDYSGLRIQKMNSLEEEVPSKDEELEYDDEGQVVVQAEVQAWKTLEVAPTPPIDPWATEVQSTVGMGNAASVASSLRDGNGDVAPSSPGPQKYIPPAQRQAMKAAALAGEQKTVTRTVGGPRRLVRAAPDISNQELFPSLSGRGVAGKTNAWGGVGVGTSASGHGPSPLAGGGKLVTDVSLENKWEALSRGAE